jgi:hypothetical protein
MRSDHAILCNCTAFLYTSKIRDFVASKIGSVDLELIIELLAEYDVDKVAMVTKVDTGVIQLMKLVLDAENNNR